MSAAAATARSLGLASCHECGLLVRVAGSDGSACPRCRASLHSRQQDAVARCWALLFAAAVLYVPANVLPIMTTISLAGSQVDTIMSGVVYLAKTGDWPLAVVVFVASVMVPVLKLVVLAFLLWSVQTRSRWRPADRTRLYRIVDLIGRWSMVDIYVVAVLVALVRLDALASVDAGMGAVFFGAVVVLTLIAAESFDPRLIWDAAESADEADAAPLAEGSTA